MKASWSMIWLLRIMIKNYSYSNLKIVDDFLTESDLTSIGSYVKEIR